ncbi:MULTISPECIES: AraC family transcriptional regulator [unclassified Beijerinckia]|uniref:AraC family transcriptional regulator n=1 Tax=unclassified Beijerinckia TaxID=2638183 RepID=UPI00089679A8|nr:MULTISPECIES: AraC family transcriptional regulator [unclassified Beijerinckia]MDH7795535.1 AraC-like DNA-binding protein [Beijerinckia sp. GAS462]SEC05588.1 transcriptional regulator, AraC family [Beijerinckia sp. 28-YEA-48]
MTIADAVGQLAITSAHFPGSDYIEAFRETYGRTVMQLDIEPLPGHPLDLNFNITGFADFGLAVGHISPTRNRHTTAMIDNDDIVLVFSPQGHGSLHQIGRDVTLRDGEAAFVSNGIPGTFYGHAHSRMYNLRFNRKRLDVLTGDVEAALVKLIQPDNPTLKLLTRYTRVVTEAETLTSPDLRRAVSTHMHDLAALLLGATRDGAMEAKQRGVRAARMRAIKDDIASHLLARDLSVDALTRRHGISPRSIRALFNEEGTTFTDYVLSQRLARVHRLLCDPGCTVWTISAIAYDTGFGDLSYFNHAFRRRYGATPSDIRAAALKR